MPEGSGLAGMVGDLAQEWSALATAYAMVHRRMALRTWIAGEGFGMSDCAAAPTLLYAGTVEPFLEGFGHLKACFDSLADRPSVRWVPPKPSQPFRSVRLRMPFPRGSSDGA